MRLSTKLLGQGYVKEHLRASLRKFYDRYGDLIKQYEVPLSRMLHDILDDDHLQWHPPLIRHYTNFLSFYWSGPYYRIRLFTEMQEVSIEHLQPVRHANRGRDAYSSGHLVLYHFGTCKCSNVETNLSWTCLSPDFWVFWTSLGTSDFASPLILYQCLVQSKWSIRITTLQLTAAASSKFVHIVFKDFIFQYFDMKNTYRHFDVGKMLSTKSAKRTRYKYTKHPCGALQGVR